MAFSESLARRVREHLARRLNVTEKKMFGGIGFMLNGNLLVGVRKDSLLLRLGREQGREALLEPHASPFKIAGRDSMKGWVVVRQEGIEEDEQLSAWIEQAVHFVASLPPKKT